MHDQVHNERDKFQSRWGFLMAAVGSAVGMANVWAFPYRTAQYGGAAYLIPYFICVVLLAVTGVVSESTFGRWAETGPLGAQEKAFSMRTGNPIIKNLGIIPVVSSFAIATGYAVITGWVIRYFVSSVSGVLIHAENTGAYFGQICGNFGSIGWHFIAIAIAAAAMLGGISSSIEKLNKVLIPAFFALFVIMAVYVAFLPNAGSGYSYLFVPQWSYLGNVKTWIYALGQAFFSLSLAGSGTVIYGSYLSREEDTFSCAKNIAFFDTMAAMIAACVVIPAVFSFGIDPAAGPPLMFITLPAVFQKMGFIGWPFAIIFFGAIFSATISSLVNLYETPIEMVQQKFKKSRRFSVAVVVCLSFLVGAFLENGDIIGQWMDIMSIYLCPVGALLSAICFYWVLDKKLAIKEMMCGRKKTIPDWVYELGKYAYCGIAAIVIILGIVLGGIG